MWTETDQRLWAASGTLEGVWAGKMLKWILDSWSPEGLYIWDLVAAVTARDVRLCPETTLAIDVVLAAGPEQGRTDLEEQPANTEVCLEPDAQQVTARAADILGR